MSEDKSHQLRKDIEYRRILGKYGSIKEYHRDLSKLGKLALKENLFYFALEAYKKLNDRKRIRHVGNKALQEGHIYDAFSAFDLLNDKKGMFECIKNENDENLIEGMVSDYLDKSIHLKVNELFRIWSIENGFKDAYPLYMGKTVNTAYHLADKYDLGVGIAKGGLFLTYIFNLFGLKTEIVESHKKKKGESFNWNKEILPEELKDKNIVVFDKDVNSGRTTKRVLKELKKYNPKKIDLAVCHNPIAPMEMGFGTVLQNIPEEFTEIYYPGRFNYKSFDKAIEKLEEKLEKNG